MRAHLLRAATRGRRLLPRLEARRASPPRLLQYRGRYREPGLAGDDRMHTRLPNHPCAATTARGGRERPRLGITRSQQQAYVDSGAKGGGERGVISPNRDAIEAPAAGGIAAASVGVIAMRSAGAAGLTTAPSSLREGHSRVQCPTRSSAQARTDHQAYCSASAALATTTAWSCQRRRVSRSPHASIRASSSADSASPRNVST